MRLEVIPWRASGPPGEPALRGRLEQEGFEAFVWTDPPHSDYQAQSHDHDESLWVLAGEITFGVGGVDYHLGPGDRLMLPADTVHTARAGPAGATYLIGERR